MNEFWVIEKEDGKMVAHDDVDFSIYMARQDAEDIAEENDKVVKFVRTDQIPTLQQWQKWADEYAYRRWPRDSAKTMGQQSSTLLNRLLEEAGELSKAVRNGNTLEIEEEAADVLMLALRILGVNSLSAERAMLRVKDKLNKRLEAQGGESVPLPTE